jgi:signal transduction histidine kinase
MKTHITSTPKIGAPLTLTSVLLVAFILGGNSLLIWQFRLARQQTDRLAVVSRQMTAILRLRNSLAAFHQGLDELVASHDAHTLSLGSVNLQRDLLEQFNQTGAALRLSRSAEQIDTRFLPILDAVEIGFPHQLDAIDALAATGDWEAVNHRVADQLKPTEIEVSALAQDIDGAFTAELARSEQNTLRLESRILFLIPFLALSTFSIAALFVWVIARRVIELRFEERLSERMRITRDLHDTFLQTIQGSKLYAENALAKCSDFEGMRDAIAQLVCWLDRATEEGRSALNALRTARSDRQKLADVLQAITADARAQGSTKVVLSISGNPIELLPEVQDEVIRIAGEAIANARKHSQGREIEIDLEYAGDLSLTISDDGRGFHPVNYADVPNGHFGLRAMRERAAHIGAKLTISSSPDSGTQVKLVLPKQSLAWKAGRRQERTYFA